MTKQFEIGPIRPPSEASSLLLRITRNCPWNKCKFCTIYKKHRFSTRSIDEIKADIDQVASYRNQILNGQSDSLCELPEEALERYRYVTQWVASGGESVFLQDANTMVLSFDKLREILIHLRKTLPWVKRVTTYGRADSLNRFTIEQLSELREAGLNRVHAGYESGSDEVLELIGKGATKAQEIEAGQKVKASGIELSVYFMPGVGGKNLSKDNAIETADVINKINPDFVRIRTFVAQKGTQLLDDFASGQIKECTDYEKAMELKKMIEQIDNVDGHLFSDHIVNLFEDVEGHLTADKDKILSVFSAFEALDNEDRRRYQIARRTGMVGSLSHMTALNNEMFRQIDIILLQLDTAEAFEAFLTKLLRRYV